MTDTSPFSRRTWIAAIEVLEFGVERARRRDTRVPKARSRHRGALRSRQSPGPLQPPDQGGGRRPRPTPGHRRPACRHPGPQRRGEPLGVVVSRPQYAMSLMDAEALLDTLDGSCSLRRRSAPSGRRGRRHGSEPLKSRARTAARRTPGWARRAARPASAARRSPCPARPASPARRTPRTCAARGSRRWREAARSHLRADRPRGRPATMRAVGRRVHRPGSVGSWPRRRNQIGFRPAAQRPLVGPAADGRSCRSSAGKVRRLGRRGLCRRSRNHGSEHQGAWPSISVRTVKSLRCHKPARRCRHELGEATTTGAP